MRNRTLVRPKEHFVRRKSTSDSGAGKIGDHLNADTVAIGSQNTEKSSDKGLVAKRIDRSLYSTIKPLYKIAFR